MKRVVCFFLVSLLVFTSCKKSNNPVSSGDERASITYEGKVYHTVKIGNQNPLVGMGMGTFGVQYQKVIAPLGGVTASPHSTYGLLYAEQGFIGIVLYGIMIIILWHSAMQQGRRFAKNVLTTRQANNKITREEYLVTSAQLLFVLVAFGIPFFSVATISYYGFFLPMTWWWGNGELLKS